MSSAYSRFENARKAVAWISMLDQERLEFAPASPGTHASFLGAVVVYGSAAGAAEGDR